MRVSAKAEYACLAMVALATQRPDDPPVQIREIAEANAIPGRYLVQILLQLKAAGLVQSTRGASGGYRLARSAERITAAEVLRAIDGPPEPPRPGSRASARILADLWSAAQQAERRVLEGTSIAQLASRASPRDWII